MDGLLLDSETIYRAAHMQASADAGFTMSDALHISLVGRPAEAAERLLTDAMGQLVREWLAKGDFDRLRCLELLIVKGWANKDVAKYLNLTEQAVASYKFQTVGRLKEMARKAGLSLEHLGEG